jgi:predicted RNA-binding Zn-ribbon protein involved in translation (DUF1610 family)
VAVAGGAASPDRYELGTVAASEAVLVDLYVNLRQAIASWAAVTNQTPQARMGYIGQHLTSVVTGFPGGRSGARGKDLLLPDGKSAEIKTCYRVDQLGVCSSCRHAVASIEVECPSCGSTAIDRKDDSKWLLGPKDETELQAHWEPEAFYLVLFDFADMADPRQINARIWEIAPGARGFAYCLVDYFFNIRAKSSSKAPFNLWPFSFKFGLMRGSLIYSSRINEDDTIETFIFPNERGEPEPNRLEPLSTYARSNALTTEALIRTAAELGITSTSDARAELLSAIEDARREGRVDDDRLADTFAEAVYGPRIAEVRDRLPQEIKEPLFSTEPRPASHVDEPLESAL